ncbi:fatty acid--CoA ligase [Actinocorallia lasiicapitis]
MDHSDPIRTLAESLAAQAAQRPGHPALVCEDRTTDFARLHRESGRTAHALLRAGLTAGSRAAYLGRESEHYYEIVYACARSGIVLVPVNWRLTGVEVDHVLRDSGSELLFVEREYERLAEQVQPSLPGLKHIVRIDGAEERAAGFAAWKEGTPEEAPTHTPLPADPVVQIYTSGTTGLPKGVVLPNISFFLFAEAMQGGLGWMDWRPDDKSLVSLPGFQIAGLSWTVQCLHAGITNVVMRMFVSETALNLIASAGITTTFVAPSMLQMLLDEPRATPEAFRSLRKVAYGGSPISDALLGRCLDVIGCEFLQIYAGTETGNVATCLPPKDHVPGSPLLKSAGLPCPYVELRIVGPDGTDCPTGQIGEIVLRTPAAMLEYWNLPDATSATLVDGWLRTGDAGHVDADGYLFIGDRIKDMVIIGGQNIYPVEIENALCRHPDIDDAAVFGVPDTRWGEALHACIVVREGATPKNRELMVFLRGHLADFKIPERYEQVEALPRNPAGKVMRRTLRDRFWQELDRKVN